MEKMVYKLLLKFKLTPAEPIADEPLKTQLIVTNIGDAYFPGGELTKFDIRMPTTTQKARKSALQRIPPINPNKSIELKPHPFSPIESGITWLEVELKASDGEKVDLFQNAEFNMGQQWTNNFRIRGQEYETIINLLKKIVELLEKKEKGKRRKRRKSDEK